MDRIRMLCRGQNREARRRILAAYYLGAAHGTRLPYRLSKIDPGRLSALLRHQAE